MKKDSFKRMDSTLYTIHLNTFISTYKRKPENFTRHRRMPFEDLIFAILQLHGISTVMELYHFFKSKGDNTIMSSTAFHNQRMKLDGEAFLKMTRIYLKQFYKDKKILKTFHGYLLVGIDGTQIILPTTPELIEIYGHSEGVVGQKPTAMASASTSHDLLNHMTLDCTLQKYHTSERTMAKMHMEKLEEVIGNKKVITVMDRGYYSAGMVAYFKLHKKSHFVIRIKSNDLKKCKSTMKSDDEYVTLEYTQGIIKTQKDEAVKEYMKEVKTERIRITKIMLSTGKAEYLVSDLKMEEFTSKDIDEIYQSRWEIETSYHRLKNQLKLENFSGKTKEIIEQDTYASIFVANAIQDIVQECEQERRAERTYKYEMQVNKNIATGLWKEEIIKIVTSTKRKDRKRLYEELVKKVEAHVVWIRPGRKNERKNIKKPRKSHQNQKTAY